MLQQAAQLVDVDDADIIVKYLEVVCGTEAEEADEGVLVPLEYADDEYEDAGLNVDTMQQHTEVDEVVLEGITEGLVGKGVIDANEYLSQDTQVIVHTISLEELNTNATDIVFIASLLTEL